MQNHNENNVCMYQLFYIFLKFRIELLLFSFYFFDDVFFRRWSSWCSGSFISTSITMWLCNHTKLPETRRQTGGQLNTNTYKLEEPRPGHGEAHHRPTAQPQEQGVSSQDPADSSSVRNPVAGSSVQKGVSDSQPNTDSQVVILFFY